MADDDKEKDQDDTVAVAEGDAAEGETEGGGGLLGAGGDDLMDLFEEDEVVADAALAALVASLSDININELMEQVRDIQSIVDQIQDR